jgi:hypothetical protein
MLLPPMGILILNVVPTPIVVSNEMVPPCFCEAVENETQATQSQVAFLEGCYVEPEEQP